MSSRSQSTDYDKTLGYGVALGIVIGIIGGLWTQDLLGALAIGTGASILFSYIWKN